ncbi:protein DpdD [Kineococcus sp. SYSU DK005]|uniref:protein DpdD n=1 Tax=Kineococcus sp. SYSU DK005 TaxID=3383126 RepID=UPI003D7D1A88
MSTGAALLSTWFGPGNDFSLPAEWRSDPRWARMMPFLNDCEAVPERPLFLPRRGGARSAVYAVAFNAAQGRRLQEAITAFVGPSYSDFTPLPARLDRTDALESALLATGAHSTWVLNVPAQKWTAAWQALTLLRTTWLARPARAVDEAVPVGRLLRDLRLALAGRDEDLVAQGLARLSASGGLDAANIAYLKIHSLDALGRGEKVLDLPDIHDVLRLRMPRHVRQVLLAAVHERYLSRPAERGDVDAAVEVLRLYPQYATLQAGAREGLSSQALSGLLVLDHLYPAQATPVDVPTDAGAWVHLLAQRLLQSAPALVTTVDIPALLDQGRYEQAWALIEAIDDPVVHDRYAVRCALDLNDAERSHALAQHLDARSAEHLDRVFVHAWLRETWQRHLQYTAPRHADPRDWPQLLHQAGQAHLDADVLVRLEEITEPWPDPGRADADLAETLAGAPWEGPGLTQLLDVLPVLLRRIEAGSSPRSTAAIVQLLVLSEEYTAATLAALAQALHLFLAAAPDEHGYRAVLSDLGEVHDRMVQVRTADVVLDLIDAIAAGPDPAPQVRLATCQRFLTRLRSLAARLSPVEQALAAALSQELGTGITWPAPSPVSPVDEASPSALRATVLLYTLQEHVPQRVKQALLQVHPQLTVHISGDVAGNNRLRDQAGAADVLVVATDRASHAATTFIQQHARGSVVFPRGPGSGSMLHAAVSALAEYVQAG